MRIIGEKVLIEVVVDEVVTDKHGSTYKVSPLRYKNRTNQRLQIWDDDIYDNAEKERF